MIDGLPVAASFNGGGVSTFIYDTPNADEMQVFLLNADGDVIWRGSGEYTPDQGDALRAALAA